MKENQAIIKTKSRLIWYKRKQMKNNFGILKGETGATIIMNVITEYVFPPTHIHIKYESFIFLP